MDIKEVLYRLNPPCGKCPYKLGTVKTPANPCLQCRANGYQFYERIKNGKPNS